MSLGHTSTIPSSPLLVSSSSKAGPEVVPSTIHFLPGSIGGEGGGSKKEQRAGRGAEREEEEACKRLEPRFAAFLDWRWPRAT